MLTCNKNFQSQYAFVDDIEKPVSILEYENMNTLTPRCQYGHELIYAHGRKLKSYFRHKHAKDVNPDAMTEWHAEWQGNFPYTEVIFEKLPGQIKERRADIYISDFNRIVEIQHSPIEHDEVVNRCNDYKLHNKTVVWIIDGQGKINVTPVGERRHILTFDSEPWMYESFNTCERVFYDINGILYNVNPTMVKSKQYEASEPILKFELIERLNTTTDLYEEILPQAYLYVKQQGAGSGKTYGMIQMLNSDPAIIPLKFIIFLTKQHAAVHVMFSEFREQYTNGKLTNIELLEELPVCASDDKKYIVHYKNTLSNVNVYAIFASIDSFTYAIGTASKSASDYFKSIVQSICDGATKIQTDGLLKYAGVNPKINKESIIFIDETQDLSELYGEAFMKTVIKTHTNICVVGDKLQSLEHQDNALILLENIQQHGIQTIKGDKTNIVRRFSDPQLIDFVNKMIQFERYGLPQMIPSESTASNPKSLKVFSGTPIHYILHHENHEAFTAEVNKIVDLFRNEIRVNSRVPEDFMIVTPFTAKNPLCDSVQLAINLMWKDLMTNDKEYIANVKNKHEYWATVSPSKYTRFVIFHKSQDGKTINLDESKHATQILSIQSSKGNGRKVVFVVGVSESALRVFSKITGNIVYESLLHVAITRQKEILYFRLEANNDDICKRIASMEIDVLTPSNKFTFSKNTTKLNDITNQAFKDYYDNELYPNIVCNCVLDPFTESSAKMLIDSAEHHIRFSSMFINVMVHCSNNTHNESKKQINAIFYGLQADNIKHVHSWADICKILRNNDKEDVDPKLIPLLLFPPADAIYGRYSRIIKDIMLRIKTELKNVARRTIRPFCPLESIILFYMIECVRCGIYQTVTMNDIYNIVHLYNQVFEQIMPGHEYCNCRDYFTKGTSKELDPYAKKLHDYLLHHYERIAHVNKILDGFTKLHPKVSFLYNHHVQYARDTEFGIYKRYQLIGYDSENVYNFIVRPQMNDLNKNEIVTQTLMDTWLLLNISSTTDNYKRFGNKRIITCVLTLNLEGLYIIDFTDAVKSYNDKIVRIVYDILYKKYSIDHGKHQEVYNMIVSTIKDSGTIIDDIKSQCEDSHPPPYIRKLFDHIESLCDECDDEEGKFSVINKYTKKLDENLDKRLDKALMTCLHTHPPADAKIPAKTNNRIHIELSEEFL